MQSAPKIALISTIVLLLLIGLGVGGYFLWLKVDKQHDENLEQLSGFGSKVVPISQGPASERISIGTAGQVQLPPSIQEKKLSATERVIIALSQEKEALVTELAEAKDKVSRLEKEVTALRGHKDDNARFAPLPLQEERNRAIAQLKEFFATSRDASRFSEFQTEAMTLAAANVYMEVLRRYRLSFDEQQKDLIVARHLPTYGFCVGDSIGLLANNRQEERLLLQFLNSEDVSLLSGHLEQDIRAITDPCLQGLNRRISAML